MKRTTVFAFVLAAAAGLCAGYLAGSALLERPPETPETAPENTAESRETARLSRTEIALDAQNVAERPSYVYDPGVTVDPDVLTANWYGDTEAVHESLLEAKNYAAKPDLPDVYDRVISAVTSLASLSKYLEYKETVSITVGDTVYGAYTEDEASPIGGGRGYGEIFTTGDYIVTNYKELSEACRISGDGDVIFIPSGVTIDLTFEEKPEFSEYHLSLHRGVTLASDRGYVKEDGSVSPGAKLCGYGGGKDMANAFIYCNAGARITGLVIQGPDPERHIEHHYRAFSAGDAKGSAYYWSLPMVHGINVKGKDVEIDNCEISGFAYAAVLVNAGGFYAHHNYVHHNQLKGLGYGFAFDGAGAGGIIEYNLFNFNRHSISGSGLKDVYYTARYNVDMGDVLNHVYDMHGGADRGDGTDIAGKFVEIYNNTFLADDYPYFVRGVPVEYHRFYRNVVIGTKDKYDFRYLTGKKYEIYDNIFGIKEKTVVK